MKKKLVIGFALCMAMLSCTIPAHATEASGEAVVGFDVGEDDLFRLNVQVIGYGFVLDGRARIRTSVTYEVPTGINKEFEFHPDEGYKIKQVIYEKPADDYKQDLTANLQGNRVVIPTVSTDMKITVVYEKLPDKGRKSTVGGIINTGDKNDVYPYLILILGALMVFSDRNRRWAVERNTNKNMEEMKMKKNNKVLMTGMAALLAMPMFATSIMATEGKNDGEDTHPDKTIVSYNNANVIPDPDGHPATWGVEVPKAITFTDKVKSIRADVKLVDLSSDGNPGYPNEADAIAVKVQSENGYFMELSDPDEKDPLKYTLGYDKNYDKTIDAKTENMKIQKATDEEFGKLWDANKTIKGLAVKQSDALQTGNHTDRLIYTIVTTK